MTAVILSRAESELHASHNATNASIKVESDWRIVCTKGGCGLLFWLYFHGKGIVNGNHDHDHHQPHYSASSSSCVKY